MSWIENTFFTQKPIIGMCHLSALPGDPAFSTKDGIDAVIKRAIREIKILQDSGIDGVLISNEFSYPYMQNVPVVSVLTMARIIGELKREIHIPFGVDCMYDPYASKDLSVATDADFYRITLNKASLYDYKYGTTALGDQVRHISNYGMNKGKCIINIDPSVRASIENQNVSELIETITIQINADAFCISADTIHTLVNMNYELPSDLFKSTLLLCDGGCTTKNIHIVAKHSDGVIVGTALKQNQQPLNEVCGRNTKELVKLFKEEII